MLKFQSKMSGFRTICRLTATAILLLMGGDLLACEWFSPSTCELSTSHAQGSVCVEGGCLCCCSHVVVAAAFVVTPVEEAVTVVPAPEIRPANFEPEGIYHPPRI
jgi:hypothetical protein